MFKAYFTIFIYVFDSAIKITKIAFSKTSSH